MDEVSDFTERLDISFNHRTSPALQNQTAVAAYLKRKQLLLFVFVTLFCIRVGIEWHMHLSGE